MITKIFVILDNVQKIFILDLSRTGVLLNKI